jgi:hypothetical protein
VLSAYNEAIDGGSNEFVDEYGEPNSVVRLHPSNRQLIVPPSRLYVPIPYGEV